MKCVLLTSTVTYLNSRNVWMIARVAFYVLSNYHNFYSFFILKICNNYLKSKAFD